MDTSDVARFWEANAETWTSHARRGLDVHRDALNTPAFMAMLPHVLGMDGLDIGCGEGANTRHVARRGARMSAVDIAPTFVRHAQEIETSDPLGIMFTIGNGMALPFEDGTFDFATAFMSLMDMPEPERALREAARILRPGGFLQFSILHPCFVPPHRKVLRDASGHVRAVEVAGYFDRIDGRADVWSFTALPEDEKGTTPQFRTPRFHRTLSEWVGMILAAGLVIEAMAEPSAERHVAEAEPIVADTLVVPLFLHVRARKPGLSPSMSLDHVQLAMPADREDDARAFYAGVLGMDEVTKPENLAGRGGCWFVKGSAKLHLGVEREFVPARKAHPALLIPDLDEARRRFEEAGIACVTDEPLAGYQRLYVTDPFGNRIEVMQRSAEARPSFRAGEELDEGLVRLGELRLLDCATRVAAQAVADLLHDDFVEFGSSGNIYDKATTIAALSGEKADDDAAEREASDLKVQRLGSHAMLVTYTAVRRQVGRPGKRSLRSSIWVRTEPGWRMLFHQGTLAS